MPTNDELRQLLIRPSEALNVEYKSWLDLSNNEDKARLAKAAIAIANHGGGIIVLGMRENADAGSELISIQRPASIQRYSLDLISSAIVRYAVPSFQTQLLFDVHPGTNVEHAFVIIEGGLSVPVMSKRDCERVIASARCYIRKPGPRSEEPHTPDEWKELLERCLSARRESMLEAIRSIVLGHVPSQEAPPDLQYQLSIFERDCLSRWGALNNSLDPGDPGRITGGYYFVSASIDWSEPASSLSEVRRCIERAGSTSHTGWGAFVIFNRSPTAPVIRDGSIEAWLGAPEPGVYIRDSAHSDYWRATQDGWFFQLRGYDEDVQRSDRTFSGPVMDLTRPIWRVSEILLFLARLAQCRQEGANLTVRCTFTGLAGRTMVSIEGSRHVRSRLMSHDNEVTTSVTASAQDILDNTDELIMSLLTPLYERFDFMELTRQLVSEEIRRMRSGRF